MDSEGNEVEKDIKLAREWYRKVVDKGCEEAQSALKRLEQLLH